MSAHGSAGHGEDGVDADGAHERAFAGHVGAADEEDFRSVTDADVVADTLCGWDEGVAELLGVEAGRAFEEFRKGVGGVLVTVGGEGEKRFDFADCREPGANRGSVGRAPGLGCIGDLNRVEQRMLRMRMRGLSRERMYSTMVRRRAMVWEQARW